MASFSIDFPLFLTPSVPLLPHPTTESLHDKEDTKPGKVMASKEMLENLSPTNKHYESGIVPRVMRIYWLSSLGKKKNIWLCRIFTIEFFSFFWAAAKETCNEKEKPEFVPVYGRLKEKKKKTASTWQSLGKQVCLWLPTIPSDPILSILSEWAMDAFS